MDLGQLWEYWQRSPGRQPFYAFPWPDWDGNLKAVAIAEGRAVTELGFSRSGPGWWFADWMVVLTAAQVAAVLHDGAGGAWHEKARPKEAASSIRRE